MDKEKGFTLIELLVVIAIIGVLSSIIVVSVSGARNKGKDASIKQNLSTARSQITFYFAQFGDYGDPTSFPYPSAGGRPCDNVQTKGSVTWGGGSLFSGNNPTTPTNYNAITSVVRNAIIQAQNSSGGGANSAICYSDGVNKWAVSVPLKSNPANSWCIDVSGAAKEISGGISAGSTTKISC